MVDLNQSDLPARLESQTQGPLLLIWKF